MRALVSAVTVASVSAALFAGEDGDVGLILRNGVLSTALASDEAGDVRAAFLNTSQRVFEGEFNVSGFADEPGFYVNGFSRIDPGVFVGYNNIGPLLRWDDSTGTFVDSGTTLTQINGPFTLDTPTTDIIEEGFRFAYNGGEFDEHPDLQLNDISEPGAFLWNLNFFLADAAVGGNILAESENVFVVVNFGLEEAAFEEAVEAAEVLIPTPSSVAAMGAMGLLAARRRRGA